MFADLKKKFHNAGVHRSAMKNLFAQTTLSTLGALEETPTLFWGF